MQRFMLMRFGWILMLFVGLSAIKAQEPVDEAMNALIRAEGLENSAVMKHASLICDVYGPRLTGTHLLEEARNWAVEYLTEMGMNARQEAWGPFGRGWELRHFEMHANDPNYWPVLAHPKAWSPSTNGTITSEVVYMQVSSEEELEQYRGMLQGKFVMLDTIRDLTEWFDPLASRHTAESLLELANADVPTPRPRRSWQQLGGFTFNQALWQFFVDEGVALVIDRGWKGDLGTIFVAGARTSGEGNLRPQDPNATIVPQVTMSVEHYNRIMRLLNMGKSVELSVNIQAEYTMPNDGMEYNVIAEIPGTDLAHEVVMFGAHFDSWHGATGATDNGAGSAVMIEAARILMAAMEEAGVQNRRTLRIALWTGEEQGLFGSRYYVGQHFAEMVPGAWVPTALKPDHDKVSAYYNFDNGTGKIRGIHLQGNEAAGPVFRSWLAPFADLEANTITLGNTGGTDHLAFDGVGIPGFQFIQDPIAYSNRTHHSTMDNYDHLVEDDLKQAATIIASFVWHTSQRDERIPRKPFEIRTEQ